MAGRFYRLDSQGQVHETDADGWLQAIQQVEDNLFGEVRVSTVFLGLNHNFLAQDPPLLFETMVFGGVMDGHQERYCSLQKAREGHKRVCEMVVLSMGD